MRGADGVVEDVVEEEVVVLDGVDVEGGADGVDEDGVAEDGVEDDVVVVEGVDVEEGASSGREGEGVPRSCTSSSWCPPRS